MQSRIRKLIAVLLITVLAAQQGSAVVTATEGAAETTAEKSTEPMTQAPAETQPPATEAPPETQPPATEPPQTEPATQAPTEPPQTEPATQAPTEPPQTEPVTQAPTETEPATQAPTETEPTTQAPTEPETPKQTEKETQAPTEPETPKQTEKETTGRDEDETNTPAPPVPEFPTESESETETEAQTDVKDRQNDGTRVRVSVIEDGLIDVLPYLIAANSVTGVEYAESGEEQLAETAGAMAAGETEMESESETEPESGTEETEAAQEEKIPAEDVLSGADAAYILDMLEPFSLEIANGRATRTVKVINLYVGEDGNIDSQRLKDALAVKLPNVKDELVVVNVIAASADQDLSFSGYDIYTEAAGEGNYKDAGRVLYNFASFEYVNENEIKFVDYEGTVTLSNGDGLEGTWLAPTASVNVASDLAGAVYADKVSVSAGVSLEKVRLAQDAQEETDLKAETQTESGTESSPEEETDAFTEETEPLSEEETEAPETEPEPVSEEDTELPETESESEEDTELLLVDDNEALAADEVSGVSLAVHVLDGTSGNAPVDKDKVSMEIKAAEDITNAAGEVIHRKDAQIARFSSTGTAAGYPVGSHLANNCSYYAEMEANDSQTYLPGARVYFRVDGQGHVLAGTGKTETEVTSLNYYVYQFSGSGTVPGGMLVVEAPSGTTFVVKDKDKEILKDAAGKPLYYLVIPGSGTTGRAAAALPAGTYYLSQLTAAQGYTAAADQEFVIGAAEGRLITVTNAAENARNSNTLHVSAETYYGQTSLTAERELEIYVALFSDEKLTQRITGIQKIVQESGTTASGSAALYVKGTAPCYLAETNEFGVPVTDYEKTVLNTSKEALQSIVFTAENRQAQTVVLHRNYGTAAYPDGLFSYMADISITKNVQDNKKNPQPAAVTDEFYISLFRDAALTHLEEIVPISLENESTKTVTISRKVTKGQVVYHAAETDASGVPTDQIGNGTYAYKSVSYEGTVKGGTNKRGRFDVICGEEPKLTVTNTLSGSVVKIRVVDSAGRYLPGAELVIKNSDRKVLKINGEIILESKSEDIVWTGILPAGNYYLSEAKAPAGYMPATDEPFTAGPGLTTEVSLVNTTAKGSGKVTVGIQVYEGTNQLYAKNEVTRYVALFLDAAHTQKATNVQKVTISGFTGSTTFEHLEEGMPYYVAETDQYGQVRSSNDTRTISYTNGGMVSALASNAQMVASENYAKLPESEGFRYTARFTVEKRVVDSSDQAKAVSGSFYVGFFRQADYKDTPDIVRIDLNNASSAEVSRRVLLSGTSDVTYYIAEVDANGKRVADSADFNYTPTVDKAQITLTKGSDEKIVVTNKDKVSKVTLYLTKRVYEGSTLKTVNATFYAGLFRDAQFTKLYANPIQMNIQNNNSVTLKLSLNLGAASEATIYVAEVDKDGKVVQSGASFGYDTRVVNSTVHFTQQATEIQSIILNTVAGTATDDDWNDIYSSSENDVGGGSGSYSDYISDNGSASSGTASSGSGYDDSGSGSSSVQTADNTPWEAYLVLMIVSGTAILAGDRRRRRIRK